MVCPYHSTAATFQKCSTGSTWAVILNFSEKGVESLYPNELCQHAPVTFVLVLVNEHESPARSLAGGRYMYTVFMCHLSLES